MAFWKVGIKWVGLFLLGLVFGGMAMFPHHGSAEEIPLPSPSDTGDMSLETALQKRRSVRDYRDRPLTLTEVSQLLWAAQGVTSESGYRTAPSAGALYPLEVYLAAGPVTGLPAGVYKYRPHGHKLVKIAGDDLRSELAAAALGQHPVRDSAAALVMAAVYERTTAKYGRRGVQYVHMEIGHAAQNVYLQAESLELGTVFIGAFDDGKVKGLLKMPDAERPLGIMPIGKPD